MLWSPVSTIGDALAEAAAERPGAEAIVFPGERVTYAQLDARADEVARALLAHGVEGGDKVGLLLPGSLDFYVALFAIARIGAVPVPINTRYRTRELAHVVVHADVRLLLTSDAVAERVDFVALLREALPDRAAAPELRHLVNLGPGAPPGYVTRADFHAAAAQVDAAEVERRRARVCVRDVAMIMYTSGTTAAPKGCMLSHEALVRNGRVMAAHQFALEHGDRFWCPLPVFHIGGIVPMLACVAARCAYVHPGFFEAGRALAQLSAERCTVAYPAFDLIWLAVLDHPGRDDGALAPLRLTMLVGSPERLATGQARLPTVPQVTAFGATECAAHLTGGLPDEPEAVRVSTFAHLLPGAEARIVDADTGAALGPGERGELLYRGPQLFSGYYKDPELTAAAIDADGWFHSGDLAVADEAGRIAYVGRLKDMLKVGGENVAAAEIEDHLCGHPAVNIAQVVAAPDARYAEVPAAFVELKAGASATEQELIGHCAGRIASFKVPRYVRFVAPGEWPLSGTKIRKVELREAIAAELRERGVTQAPRVPSGAGGEAVREDRGELPADLLR